MMNSYISFAECYDDLTENVEYKVRSEYISNFFYRYKKGGKTVLDLACGTGSIAKELAEKGYEVTGLDLSEEMLSIASEKGIKNAVFVKGDMKDFNLPYGVDYCICSLDAINHLSEINEVKSCFNCVFNALNEGGIFVFDVNTPYKHNVILKDRAFVFDEEKYFLAWDNQSSEKNKIDIFIDIFINNGNSYERFTEEFSEIAYENEEIIDALSDKFEVLGIYDDLTENPPHKESERIYFVCKRK